MTSMNHVTDKEETCQDATEHYPLLGQNHSHLSVQATRVYESTTARPTISEEGGIETSLSQSEEHQHAQDSRGDGSTVLHTIVEYIPFTEGLEHAAETVVETWEHATEQVTETFEHVTETVRVTLEHVTETMEHAAEIAFEAVETLEHTAEEVKGVFVSELHDADESNDHFFVIDMNLTRGLSLLPGDVVDATEGHVDSFLSTMVAHHDQFAPTEGTATPQDVLRDENVKTSNLVSTITTADAAINLTDGLEKLDELEEADNQLKRRAEMSNSTPLSAYALLLSAVIALSSIGPLLAMQQNVSSATLKITWRTTATALIVMPLAMRSLLTRSIPVMNASHWLVFALTSVCYAAYCVFYAWSLDYTSVGNATILSNSQAVLLLIGKFFVGQRISRNEAAGAVVAFVGAILCSRDSAGRDASATIDGSNTLLGDFLAILSAITGVFYIVFAKTVRPFMDLSVFMYFVMILGACETLAFLMLQGVKFTFNRDETHGVFGWMNHEFDRLPLEIIIVLICNVVGTMGYIMAMKNFSNLVILVAGLLEPVVAEMIAVAIGVGDIPESKGWIGNALVIFGTIAVVYKPSIVKENEPAD